MDKDLKLITLWMRDCTEDELVEFLQLQEFDEYTDELFILMLERYEIMEEYEKCSIVKNEIDFRKEFKRKFKKGC